MSRDSINVRILIRDLDMSLEEVVGASTEEALSRLSTSSSSTEEGSVKRAMEIEFMMAREKYRMQYMVEAVTTYKDELWFLAKVMNLVTVYREYQVRKAKPAILILSADRLSRHCILVNDHSPRDTDRCYVQS